LKYCNIPSFNAKKSYLFLIVIVLSCNTITTKPTKSDEIAMIRESQTENDNHSKSWLFHLAIKKQIIIK